MDKGAKVVMINWVDSSSQPFWQDEQEYKVLACMTIGFLVKETDSLYAVALTRGLDSDAKPWCDVVVIPKVSVTGFELLDFNKVL